MTERVEKIEAVRVKEGTISRRVNTVGKLQANASIVIKSEIPGRIREIHIKDGQEVSQGDLLIDIAAVADAPSAYHLGFILGPRINAGGRVGQADLGSRLLTTLDTIEAQQLAQKLDFFRV